MIRVIEKKKKGKPQKPYYILKYNYMIGDADGDTSEKCDISIDNPFLERYVTLLNSLKPTKGTWGLCLDSTTLKKAFGENQITEDDYNFLKETMFEGGSVSSFTSSEDKEWTYEFSEGVRSEAEYSFLVFEGCDIKYVDEWGEKHNCEIV